MIAGHDDVRVAGLLGLVDLEARDRAERDDEAEAERAADEQAEERADHARVSPQDVHSSTSLSSSVPRSALLGDLLGRSLSHALPPAPSIHASNSSWRLDDDAAPASSSGPSRRARCRSRLYSPSTSGVTRTTLSTSVGLPSAIGTRSRLMRHSGTQKEWRTSSAERCSSSWVPDGTWNSSETTPVSGILERPLVLLRGDVHLHLVRRPRPRCRRGSPRSRRPRRARSPSGSRSRRSRAWCCRGSACRRTRRPASPGTCRCSSRASRSRSRRRTS